MVQIKNPVTIIKKGGGGAAKPTTWAALKAMSTAELSAIFPVGNIIDSIECRIADTTGSTVRDWHWQVADYGTCKLENDETEYPCVTLLAAQSGPTALPFDGPEQVLCDSATETQAEADVYYYGTTATSGNPSASNTTALNLAAGDPIPYSDYARIFKSSINTTAQNFVNLYTGGYNNYYYSNIRQYLNKSGNAGEWYIPSHVGDTLASTFNSHRGFLTGVPADFLAVLAESEIKVTGNNPTDSGAVFTMYDKFFLPSQYEVQLANSPADGTKWGFVTTPYTDPARRCKSALGAAANGSAEYWWLRSPDAGSVYSVHYVHNYGGSYYGNASYATRFAPACKIILQS